MKSFLNKVKDSWQWISLFITIIGGFWGVFTYFNNQNEELAETSMLAQQAIIWNKDVPQIQRAEVCDLYLSKGYDSYTKKICENIILQDDAIAKGGDYNE